MKECYKANYHCLNSTSATGSGGHYFKTPDSEREIHSTFNPEEQAKEPATAFNTVTHLKGHWPLENYPN